MKKILFTLFNLPLFLNATNYYVSETGNDQFTGTNEGAAWRSISKVNSFSFQPGDSILFKRDGLYPGTLVITKSGTCFLPIVFGAYGVGKNPIISGFNTVSSWVSIGNGIFETTCPVSNSLNMVVFNDTLQPVGRYPKTGYLIFQSHSGNTSITSNQISSAPNFSGGEIVIKKQDYILDRGRITSQTSTTVTYFQPIAVQKYSQYANVAPYNPTDGKGFFFQNHVNACTQLGEWAFDTISRKLRMYFGNNNPASYNVKIAILDSLVDITNKSFIHFNNLSFIGANVRAVKLLGSNNIQFNNCEIDFCGITGIEAMPGTTTSQVIINNCKISNCNNNAITAGYSFQWLIKNNTIDKIGMVKGAGLSGGASYEALSYLRDKTIVENNVFKNIGYNAINFRGDSVIIRNNLLDSFCLNLQDCGGIYTYAETTKTGRKISNNIVLNGLGGEGSPNTYGIYIDGGARNVEVLNNTVAHCGFAGIELNYPQNVTITGNTFYDNGLGGISSNSSAGVFINRSTGQTITGLTIKNNIAFAKLTEQLIIYTNTATNDFSTWGIIDSNFYCRPINEPSGINGIIGFSPPPPYNDGGIIVAKIGANTRFYSLDAWKTLTGVDANTAKTPVTISDVNNLRFEYNATNLPLVIPLEHSYKDVKGTLYTGAVTLLPFTSVILIKI